MSNKTGLGTWTLTFLVVANMVGAGVFTTSGFTLAAMQQPSYVVLAWAIGGAIALCGAYSYGLLASAMPESGGEYLFLSKAAHPLLGFIAGWVSLIAGFTGAIAYAATTFESYVYPESAADISWLPRNSVAIGLIIVCGFLHAVLPKVGSRLQNVTVAIKLLLIVGFILFAATQLGNDGWHGEALSNVSMTPKETFTSFSTSLIWISLSYLGFNAAVYVAGEVEDAKKIVPRSLLLGTSIVTVVYVLLNAVFVYVPPPESIAGQANIATIVGEHLGGERLARAIRILITVALLTSVSSMIMAAPRVYSRMADDGFLPAALRFGTRVPNSAVFLQVVLAIVIVLISTLQGLLSYLGLTLSISAACSVGCLFLPSVRQSPLWSFKMAPPLLFILATAITATFSTIDKPQQLIGVVATFAIGAIIWLCIPNQTDKAQHD